MDNSQRWRRAFPSWRYWVEPPAVATFVGGIFWVILGLSGVSDVNIAWQFLAFGFCLTLFSWGTVAHTGAKSDRQSDAMSAKLERIIESLGLKPELESAKQEVIAARGDAEEER